jgi:hypothetical protein
VEFSPDEAVCVAGADGSDARILADHRQQFEGQVSWGPAVG